MKQKNLHASYFLKIYLVLQQVWRQLLQHKLGTCLTFLVIGCSLTLPTFSYLVWKNLAISTQHFSPRFSLTLYLDKKLTSNQTEQLLEKVKQQEGVAAVKFISRQEGLMQLQQWSDFAEALKVLDENPLPDAITVEAKPTASFVQLKTDFQHLAGVSLVKANDDWQDKLFSLTQFAAKVAIGCVVLMLLTVFLVVGNSIRAEVDSRKPEIEVLKLLGATDHYILRPFLYTGIFYGLVGGSIACLFSLIIEWSLRSDINVIATQFSMVLRLVWLSPAEVIFLLMSSVLLGYLASWITARKHLRKV
ncbi:cell division protein FtsX [Mergibacter septicus]|uniref:Cell division protein FtsX n=1 Tax=Mergibacter septicus TaxID=221402 RepID=A0A8E3S936_9PAST|nr:permease-like cell division protein FtsX [Mergibacter septicus]AWX16156.1 cell division protein FtsX [Mergibacter septicus]QDJ15408.1 cell division protein FtsX [Mergibacter septicus]UTU48720.1 cell division protein FtsX [Mergibacter septicus]WMR95647.1 permease-like cell division protein FtsX [Mergibacter septicus]